MRLLQQVIQKQLEKINESKKASGKNDYSAYILLINFAESLQEAHEENAIFLPDKPFILKGALITNNIKKLQEYINENKKIINTALQITDETTRKETRENQTHTGGRGVIFIEEI